MSGWFELLIWHFFYLVWFLLGWLQSRLEPLPPRGKWKAEWGAPAAGLNQPTPLHIFTPPPIFCILLHPILFFFKSTTTPLLTYCKSEERSVQLFSLVCHRRREVWVTKVKMAKVLRGSVCCGRLLCFLSQQLSQTVGLISTLPAKNCQRIVNKIYKTFSQQLPQQVFPAH